MNNMSIDEVLSLKRRAVALRNNEMYIRALDILDDAIKQLEVLRAGASDDERLSNILRSELADTYGMKGGIYRRLEYPKKALINYSKGAELEMNSTLSTYNLGNKILLSIMLGDSRVDEESTRTNLHTAINKLKQQVSGGRSDEWWAWADLGQFYLLNRDIENAKSAYAAGRETGPSPSEYQRSLDILAEVSSALEKEHPEQATEVKSFIRQMRFFGVDDSEFQD